MKSQTTQPSTNGSHAHGATIDHRGVDWARVKRGRYTLTQRLTYEYPGPIANLQHRLLVVPRREHGGQRLLHHRLEATGADYRVREEVDGFGNRVDWFHATKAGCVIDFASEVVVERSGEESDLTLTVPEAIRYLDSTPLTMPDGRLLDAAADLAGYVNGEPADSLAGRINTWVYHAMVYAHGYTTVATTAAEALSLRHGLCQDFAHIMLALCRLCGLPARYVSGHLLGEGGSHAWVEVLCPSADRPDEVVALPFDPTHGRRAGLNYITVAVGRDYADVAPTSGSYTAPYVGFLQASKQATIAELEYH